MKLIIKFLNWLVPLTFSKESFKIKGDQHIHSHFLCEDCGISTCLPLEVQTVSIPGYSIKSSEQLYLGQCNNCA